MSLLAILEQNARAIRLAEIAALIHDLDKASPKFIEDSNYHTNPSEQQETYLAKKQRWHELLGDLDVPISFSGINLAALQFYDADVTIDRTDAGSLSAPFVYHHQNNAATFPMLGVLVHGGGGGADGIDSELDKNTPENGEQKQRPFKIDTPFGVHDRDWAPQLESLCELVRTFDWEAGDLSKLKAGLKDRMSRALGETRFPCNDVSLWVHSYSVASLTKAILAKTLIEFCADSCSESAPYELPGRSRKSPNRTDLAILEVAVDRDYVLSRAQKVGDIAGMVDQISALQDHVRGFVEGELLIGNESYRDEARQLFIIPKLGTWRREGRPVLAEDLHQRFLNEVRERLGTAVSHWLATHHCHEFPVGIRVESDAEPRDSGKKGKASTAPARILERSRALLTSVPDCRQSVRALQELPGADGLRCEVCGVRSRGTRPVEREEKVCPACYARRHDKARLARRNIREELITSDLGSLLQGTTDNKLVLVTVAFDCAEVCSGTLFGKTGWKEANNGTDVSKNPSPGRMARCWETFQNFFEGVENAARGLSDAGFFPITLSPVRLELVLPATAAPSLLDEIYRKYEAQFGKFRETLPLSMAAIFFYHRFPLYVVLEAARRMQAPLRPGDSHNLTVETVDTSDSTATLRFAPPKPAEAGPGTCPVSVEWRIPAARSDGERDEIHPRFGGKLVNDLDPGDRVAGCKDGRFDLLLVDSAVRRHSIRPEGLEHHILGLRPSYPLSVWPSVVRLRKLLRKLKRHQVGHIEGALAEKMHCWREHWHPENPAVRGFCTTVVFSPNAFGRIADSLTEADRRLLIAAAANGLLLDVIDLYTHVTDTLYSTETKEETHS